MDEPRAVPIDEVFTWKEDFGKKAKEAFGGHNVDVSPQTFSDLKQRCDLIERDDNPYFERRIVQPSVPFNGINVHVSYRGLADGF
jgi:hypothetical protein